MKIGVLTSSRADFGIYLPLIKKVDCEVIVFGSHKAEGTIDEIARHHEINHVVSNIIHGDKPRDISWSMGYSLAMFSRFWDKNKFDLVFALGDR